MERLLHTPEGVRDIYDEECRKKNVLSDKLVQTLNLYGYEDIQTPSFEFFDTVFIESIKPNDSINSFDNDII